MSLSVILIELPFASTPYISLLYLPMAESYYGKYDATGLNAVTQPSSIT